MRRISFIITILGLITLTFFLEAKPIEIGSLEDLKELETNTKVTFTDNVLDEKILYEKTKLLKLENGIDATATNLPSVKNKKVRIIGVVDRYNGLQVKTLSLKIID